MLARLQQLHYGVVVVVTVDAVVVVVVVVVVVSVVVVCLRTYKHVPNDPFFHITYTYNDEQDIDYDFGVVDDHSDSNPHHFAGT